MIQHAIMCFFLFWKKLLQGGLIFFIFTSFSFLFFIPFNPFSLI